MVKGGFVTRLLWAKRRSSRLEVRRQGTVSTVPSPAQKKLSSRACPPLEGDLLFSWIFSGVTSDRPSYPQLPHPRLQSSPLHPQHRRCALHTRNPPLRLPQRPQNMLPLRLFQRRNRRCR